MVLAACPETFAELAYSTAPVTVLAEPCTKTLPLECTSPLIDPVPPDHRKPPVVEFAQTPVALLTSTVFAFAVPTPPSESVTVVVTVKLPGWL